MRCKPGQLAVLTGTLPQQHVFHKCLKNCLGAIVLPVIVDEINPTFGPMWNLDKPVRCPNCRGRFPSLPDSMLTPLKGPGREEDVYSSVSISTDVRAPSREPS
jgi:hypothetical protein